MSKELVITKLERNGISYLSSSLVEDKKVIELRLSREDKKSILGNIYVGRVDKLVRNLNAAFINIDADTPCYYDRKTPVQPGQTVVVQVIKDAVKMKTPCVSTNLSFTGKYLVLTTENKTLGFSAKISKETKELLRKWMEPLIDGTFGAVMRTNAGNAEKQEILDEFAFLKKRLDRICEIGEHRTAYTVLEEALPFYIEAVRDAYQEDLTRIVTDDKICYNRLENYMKQYQANDLNKLEYYQDDLLALKKLFSIETTLAHALRERVWLPSGGFLIIQQTEAFVSIDVNSGNYVSKKKAQEAYRKVNNEAAVEIAKQLRLRNLAGIILIDFINLSRKEDREELFHVLQKLLRKDPIKTRAIDMTQLQITEVTRQRARKSLAEEL